MGREGLAHVWSGSERGRAEGTGLVYSRAPRNSSCTNSGCFISASFSLRWPSSAWKESKGSGIRLFSGLGYGANFLPRPSAPSSGLATKRHSMMDVEVALRFGMSKGSVESGMAQWSLSMPSSTLGLGAPTIASSPP